MSVLTANLRHLYQRRELWLAYPMLALFVWVGIAIALDDPATATLEGRFIGLIVFAFMVGMAAMVLQMETLSKPMSFCLPGHRPCVRRVIFVIGLVTNALSSLLFLAYPGLPFGAGPGEPFGLQVLVLCSAFFAGWIFYLAGATLTFRCRQANAFVVLLVVILFAAPLLKLHVALERIVVLHPLFVIGLGLTCAAGAWVYLNNAERVRRHCSTPWVALIDCFNREKIRQSQRQREAAPWKKLKDHPRPWIEHFFLTRMTGSQPLETMRFVWGGLYNSFAIMLSQWKNAIFPLLFFAIFLGYLGPRVAVMPAFFLPLIAMAGYASQPLVYSVLMLAGGRKERFYSTLAVVFAGAGLLTLFVMAISLLSVLLAPLMPDFEFYGLKARYHSIGLQAVYAVQVYLPLAAGAQLVLYRRPVITTTVLVTLCYLIAAFVLIWTEFSTFLTQPWVIVCCVTLCWLIFIAILRHITTKRCLVK